MLTTSRESHCRRGRPRAHVGQTPAREVFAGKDREKTDALIHGQTVRLGCYRWRSAVWMLGLGTD